MHIIKMGDADWGGV